MSNRDIERVAAARGISNNAAKKMMRRRKGGTKSPAVPVRGMPVAGTGKPKGE